MIDIKRQEAAFEKLNSRYKEFFIKDLFKITAGGDIDIKFVSSEKKREYSIPIYANSLEKKGLYGYTNVSKVNVESITVTGRGNIGHAIHRKEAYYPIVRLLTLISLNELNYKYMEENINNINIFIESTGVPQLTAPQLGSYKIRIHDFLIQNKIARFLTAIDELIQKQEEYIQMLKIQKEGYCYKIYNQQLRFMGFKKNWEYKKINELAEVISGGTPNTRIKTYWNGNIEWYTPSEVSFGKKPKQSIRKITIEGLNASSAKLLPIGTILFTSRATIGDMLILEKEATTNQGFQSIICNDLLYNKFLINDINFVKMTKKLSSGSTFEEISGKEVKNIKIRIPNYEEQKKIGDFVSAQIEKIELHEKKLELLKIKKKYYLQEIFQ